MSKNAL